MKVLSLGRLLLVLAITLGVAAGVTLLTLVACFVCPGCLLHKKRRPGKLHLLTASDPIQINADTVDVYDAFDDCC
jgi:hypothetical protein